MVTSTSVDAALDAVGANSRRSSPVEDISGAEGISWISVAHEDAGLPEGTIALIEDNGWEGSRPDVLARLSEKGAAASVFWNVNGLMMFGCARRGKVQVSLEIPGNEDGVEELPAALRRVWQREHDVVGPVAVGMAMLEKFTGVAVPSTPPIARPRLGRPITDPVLTLDASAEGLLGLQRPSPEVVAAAGSRRAPL